MPAAIFAAQRGARVLVLEAASEVGGTLHLSAGQMSAAGSRLQAEKGIEDTPDEWFLPDGKDVRWYDDEEKPRAFGDEGGQLRHDLVGNLAWLVWQHPLKIGTAGVTMGFAEPRSVSAELRPI
ncbi:MAG: FAD-binding protein [Proteobacteria bacterium]|nr:FAD-binding protein [Pseudomonadota bacterium]